MNRRIMIMTFIFALLVSATILAEESIQIKCNDAWTKILANDFNLKESDSTDNETLLANYYLAKKGADYKNAFNIILDLMEKNCNSVSSAVYLRKAIEISSSLNNEKYFRERLKEILSRNNNINPNLKNNIHQQLINLAENFRDKKDLVKLTKNDGWIRTWAKLAGPFKNRLQTDLEDSFETDPVAESYTDNYGNKVQVVYNIKPGYSGSFSPSQHLDSENSGMVYSLALIESDQEKEVILSFVNNSSFKAWLNNMPIFRDNERTPYKKPRHLVKVNFKKGINVLIVKTYLHTHSGIQIFNTDFTVADNLKFVEWEKGKDEVEPVGKIYGYICSRIIEEPELSDNKESNPECPIGQFINICAEEEYAGLVQSSRERHLQLLEKFKDSLILNEETALFFYRESFKNVDSKERLQKEMLNLLKKIIKTDASFPRSHYMEGVYLNDHNEKEEALKKFRLAVQHSENWSRPYIEAGLLEKEFGMFELAEKNFKKALELDDNSSLNNLAELYYLQKRYKEAYDKYEKSWDSFSLHFLSYFNILLKYSDWEKAEKIISEFNNLYPEKIQKNLRMQIDFAIAKDDLKSTRKHLIQATKEFPNRTYYLNQFANLSLRQGNKEEALDFFQREYDIKLKNKENDLKLLKRIRALKDEKWLNEQYDISLDNIDVEKYTPGNYKAANHAVLLKVNVCRIFPDMSAEQLSHSAVKILTKDGLESLAELRIPKDIDDLILCRTIMPDGKIFTPTNIKTLNFSNAASMYNVVPGSTLEFSYRNEIKNNYFVKEFKDDFYFENFFIPTALSRYVLIVPKNLDELLNVESFPEDIVPERQELDEDIVYIWEKTGHDGIKPEASMPPRDEVLANIKVKLSEAIYPNDYLHFKLPEDVQTSNAIQKKAKELAKGKSNIKEIVNAIHFYIRKNLKPSNDPRTARDAFTTKSGNDRSGELLMRAMLESLGIKVQTAVVNSYLDRQTPLAKDRAQNIKYFYTPVLFIENPQGKNIWLKIFSDKSLPMSHTRPEDLGRDIPDSPAIVKDKNGFMTYHRVYEKAFESRPVDYDINLFLNSDSSAEVKGTVKFSGNTAGHLRTIADISQTGRRRIERFITSLYPKLILKKSEYPDNGLEYAGNPQDGSEDFVYNFEGGIKQFCRIENNHLSFSPFPYKFRVLNMLLAERDRKIDFNIAADIESEQSAKYTAPEGWVFSDVPQSIWWQSEYGLYAANFVVSGRDLYVSRFMIIPARRIKAENYKYFAEFIEECQRAEKLSVNLAKFDKPLKQEITENRIGFEIDLSRFYPKHWPGEKQKEN